ncbi:MAG TPA: GNAT family N-acetyltransferase [Puia sp.]|nr:GNAT family N-acetyltransferase [Puia sp.]
MGKQLIEARLDFARHTGYRQVYIKTMPELEKAVSIYERLGFHHLDSAIGNTGQHNRNGSKTGDDQQKKFQLARPTSRFITYTLGTKGGQLGWGQFLGSRFNFVDWTEKIQFSRGQFHTLIPFS